MISRTAPSPPSETPTVLVAAVTPAEKSAPVLEGVEANEKSSPQSTEAVPEPEVSPELPPRPIQVGRVPSPANRPLTGRTTGGKEVMPAPEIVAVDVRFQRTHDSGPHPVGVLRVEVEETLGPYAEWAGGRTQGIRRLNGLRYGRTLHLHQEVMIPLTTVSAAGFEEQRYEYHKRLQEDFFAVYRVTELEPYLVRSGDNYWTLCREQFDVPMWLLKHYNMEAELAALQVRQKLMVPVIAESAAGEPGTVTPESDVMDAGDEPTEEIFRASPKMRRDLGIL